MYDSVFTKFPFCEASVSDAIFVHLPWFLLLPLAEGNPNTPLVSLTQPSPLLNLLSWLDFKLEPWPCIALTPHTLTLLHRVVSLDLDEMLHNWLPQWLPRAENIRSCVPTGWMLASRDWEAGGIWAEKSPPLPSCRGLSGGWLLLAAFPEESCMPGHTPAKHLPHLCQARYETAASVGTHPTPLLCIVFTSFPLFLHPRHLWLPFPR